MFLALGTNFPDAIAAGPITAGAPILLTAPDTLTDTTTAAITRDTGSDTTTDTGPDTGVDSTTDTPAPPTSITAVGGTAVIPDDVLAAASQAAGGATTRRLAGPNRFATAAAIAATLPNPDTVYLAVGTNFPDALAAGPAAAADGAPILLAVGGADQLPQETVEYLQTLNSLDQIVLIGGTAALPDHIEDQLAALLP
ncbi:cell wall-binding repeat-containing protein [Euzebya tangerina]|uniref:cell wall-binding repeat-containing protein n=1 Tax=Euzebya tangerina TaxID=591198 RepID=UPI0039C85FB5